MIKLILDIDGVLITTPSWKPDILHADGYSDFNLECVKNLNHLLSKYDLEIWLSSTRRTRKSIDEFNEIFKNRGIKQDIVGFLPSADNYMSRKDEVESFLNLHKYKNFLVIDDDKSLNEFKYRERLILTELTHGFDGDKLNEALNILSRHS